MFSYAHVKKMLMHSGISTCCNMYIALEVYMLYVYPTFKRNKKAQKMKDIKKSLGMLETIELQILGGCIK